MKVEVIALKQRSVETRGFIEITEKLRFKVADKMHGIIPASLYRMGRRRLIPRPASKRITHITTNICSRLKNRNIKIFSDFSAKIVLLRS
jgi:hypothetical protein